MPESILDEDDDFQKYYVKSKADLPKMVALTARGVDKVMARTGIQGLVLEQHCKTSVDKAHPPACADGINCHEDDVSEEAPKEGTIFFKGKVSGKWIERIIIVVLTLIAGVGITRFLGV